MIEKILTSVLLFLYLSSFSQQTTTLSHFKSKNSRTLLESKYNQIVDSDKNDTTYSVSIKYKKAKHIFKHDTVSIVLNTKIEFGQFVDDLKAALDHFNKMEDAVWTRDAYRISVYKKGKTLYLGQSIDKGGHYTYLNKREVVGLIDWSQTITMK